MGEQDNGGGFFLGFVVGVAVGAVAALLMAPSSGEDLRRQLGDKSLELKDQAQKAAEDARVQAMKAADTAKGQVEQISERGRIVLSENAKKAQDAVQSKLGGAGDAATPV